jgi:LPS export ABC transporter protein LptC
MNRPVVVVGVMFAAILCGCEEKIKPSVLSNLDSKSLPKQESWNSQILVSDSGKTKALIRAGYIRVYDYPAETRLSDGVTVHFFDEEARESSVLTSTEGKVDDVSNDLEAMGNVVVVSNDSTVLRTERLFWDNKRRLVHTPEFVVITSPKETIQGRGFEALQDLKNYRIFHVTGRAKTE